MGHQGHVAPSRKEGRHGQTGRRRHGGGGEAALTERSDKTSQRHGGSHEAHRGPSAVEIDRLTGRTKRQPACERDPWDTVSEDDVYAGRRAELGHVKKRQLPAVAFKKGVAAQRG